MASTRKLQPALPGTMPGCIFEYYGRIPESVYTAPDSFNSPLEEAVYKNDAQLFLSLVQQGHKVGVWLKIGKMSCIEYAAMRGYSEILAALISQSVCSELLRQYFALEDIVDRAYLISRNKFVFFNQEGLAEANRYVAALYTAIAYNQPRCVEVILSVIGRRDAACHSFYTATDDTATKTLGAGELARLLGHTECFTIFTQWQLQQLQMQTTLTPVCS